MQIRPAPISTTPRLWTVILVSMKRRSTPSLERVLCTGQEDDGEDKEERKGEGE